MAGSARIIAAWPRSLRSRHHAGDPDRILRTPARSRAPERSQGSAGVRVSLVRRISVGADRHPAFPGGAAPIVLVVCFPGRGFGPAVVASVALAVVGEREVGLDRAHVELFSCHSRHQVAATLGGGHCVDRRVLPRTVSQIFRMGGDFYGRGYDQAATRRIADSLALHMGVGKLAQSATCALEFRHCISGAGYRCGDTSAGMDPRIPSGPRCLLPIHRRRQICS